MQSALVERWTRQIARAHREMLDHLSYLTWCTTPSLKALFHIRRAGLTYEGRSRMEGRVKYWERKGCDDIEKQILDELQLL